MNNYYDERDFEVEGEDALYGDFDEATIHGDEDFETEDISSSQVDAIRESKAADGQISRIMDLGRDAFVLSTSTIDISDIIIPTPIKDSRKDTFLGLTKSVEEFGVLEPIHVMISEWYSDYLDENGTEEGFEGGKYLLLDGLRRVFAAKKNGLDRINAVVWDFKDKEKGSDMILITSLVLNKTQRKSWEEIWYLCQILEEQSSLTPSTMEYLLQLEPGEAMKLKEIMTRADEFPQPREDLIGKKKSLQQAYNALMKEMKEQNQLYVEDVKGMGEVEQAEGVVQESEGGKLSDDEVKELLDMDTSVELNEDDFDEMLSDNTPEVQKVGERHPIDPALKAETLARDGYKCTCCGNGEFLPMRYKLAILQSHHKISVANSGPDSADNITSLCVSCHTLVHSLIWSNLKFGMSKEDFDAMPEEEQVKLKNVMRLARIDYEAAKKLGKSGSDRLQGRVKKSTFRMPGQDLVENAKAVKEYGGA